MATNNLSFFRFSYFGGVCLLHLSDSTSSESQSECGPDLNLWKNETENNCDPNKSIIFKDLSSTLTSDWKFDGVHIYFQNPHLAAC